MEEYKLIGSLDIFGVLPDIIWPIFEKDGKYYFQHCENYITIEEFAEMDYKCEEVVMIEENYPVKRYYKLGDEPVVAFKLDNDNIFFGTFDEFNLFIKDINIEDEMLLERITRLQENAAMARKLKKQ